MRVAAIELPARFGEVARALEDVRAALSSGPACDLALLPECGLSGYADPETGLCDPTPYAEPLDGPTLGAIRELAASHGTAVAAPLIEAEAGRCYNTFVVVSPGGELVHHYRKRHPWFPETWATPGDRPMERFHIRGVALTLAVCYDVHFLADEVAPLLEEVDVLLFPSAWVDNDEDDDLRGPIFAELASRFAITIVNANWGPGDLVVPGQGSSRVVGPAGEIVRATTRLTWSRIDAEITRSA